MLRGVVDPFSIKWNVHSVPCFPSLIDRIWEVFLRLNLKYFSIYIYIFLIKTIVKVFIQGIRKRLSSNKSSNSTHQYEQFLYGKPIRYSLIQSKTKEEKVSSQSMKTTENSPYCGLSREAIFCPQ